MGLFKKKGGPDPASTKKVQTLLSSIFEIEVPSDTNEWGIPLGSSLIACMLLGRDEELEHPETLSIMAHVLFDAPYDDDIYRYLMMDANTSYIKWQVGDRDDDGNMAVACGASMLMSTVTEENLGFVMTQVALCADLWDDKLKERFGGYRYEDMEKENRL